MKIALLHYSSPPIVGGVESVLAHHARLIAKAGHEVTVFAGRGDTFDKKIPVHVLPRLDSRHAEVMTIKEELDRGLHTPAFDALRDLLKEELEAELQGFDILIAHNVASLHKNLPLTAAIHAAYKTKYFPRLILWHHDLAWTTPRYRHEMHDGYPWNLLCTDWGGVRHIVISELRRQELGRLLGIGHESIRVIPNGVDINSFFKLEDLTIQLVEELDLLDADPLFLLPVRLTPRKNIELALYVMAELRNQFPKAVLLVTGPEGPHNPANTAYRQRLMVLRKKLKLQSTVNFLADVTNVFLPDAVIADFYRLADALFLPSREEGFGIPLIEAAFSSLPVFCSDIPVLRELCGEDVTYFDPDEEPRIIAKKIVDRLQVEISSRWSRRAKHGYSWDSIYALHINPLIQEVGK
jgi:mannosylglucosylglycerate synthase